MYPNWSSSTGAEDGASAAGAGTGAAASGGYYRPGHVPVPPASCLDPLSSYSANPFAALPKPAPATTAPALHNSFYAHSAHAASAHAHAHAPAYDFDPGSALSAYGSSFPHLFNYPAPAAFAHHRAAAAAAEHQPRQPAPPPHELYPWMRMSGTPTYPLLSPSDHPSSH